jgi:hypothetical protein
MSGFKNNLARVFSGLVLEEHQAVQQQGRLHVFYWRYSIGYCYLESPRAHQLLPPAHSVLIRIPKSRDIEPKKEELAAAEERQSGSAIGNTGDARTSAALDNGHR